ncbi:hypothetical protein RM540_08395 [Rubrivirga sp. F394]|uniref:Uncharacterized protein n=1 Tax=Rubrivirga litoralis TaxID=3075598 RepID=A0ABU3BRF5_9BACT|nr:hypothetical protein [Rubrivirga sp. F394]MDT0631761.1 hypothetical protein [Rubrivirga sp. F394]
MTVVPTSCWLSTSTAPPMRATRRSAIERPTPVPSCVRLWPCDACANGSRARATNAASIPMPVSVTRTQAPSAPPPTSTVTPPRSVNRTALSRTAESARRSASLFAAAAGIDGSARTVSERPRSAAAAANAAATSPASRPTSTGAVSRWPAPPSIHARSSMLLSVAERRRAPRSMRSRRSRWSSPTSSASTSVPPRMAVSGVRTSWLMFSRSESLARLAASARACARVRASSSTWRDAFASLSWSERLRRWPTRGRS